MLSIQNVSKIYKNFYALKNVNIDVECGDILGIVGHSGAGKSTLLRCINGLENYDSGQIFVEDKEVKLKSDSEMIQLRRNIGMIFQNFSLLERLNVYDNVALPLICAGMSKNEIQQRVKSLIKLVGIYDKIDARPKNLSGGQKQRVAIARALALSPKILLCDEATSALDPKTTKSILSLLEDINKKLGITIVIVTHQMEVVKQICNKVVVMENGKVLDAGSTEEIFLKNNELIKSLLGDDEIILPSGTNIKILYDSDISKEPIITSMSRQMNIDISIIYGKLEQFRKGIFGFLIVNTVVDNGEIVKDYLTENNIRWEEIKNEFK